MNFLNKILNYTEFIEGNIENFCYSIGNNCRNLFTLICIKIWLIIGVLFIIVIPSLIGIIIFNFITLSFGVHSFFGISILTSLLIFLIFIPQIWLILIGSYTLILILLA